MKFFFINLLMAYPALSFAFVAVPPTRTVSPTQLAASPFEVTVEIPPSNSGLQAKMKFEPVLDVPSEIIEVRYKVPFGLDVAPQKNLAVCTKDGKGGEKSGDVLRYTSQWVIGLPRGDGIISTAASFAGGVSWQCNLFDVMKAPSWEYVVEALTSNIPVSHGQYVYQAKLPQILTNSSFQPLLFHRAAQMRSFYSLNAP
jgi:hypothetical protein